MKKLLNNISLLTFMVNVGVANSQTLPLIGGAYSSNCDSNEESVNLYSNSSTADYAIIQFKAKNEMSKSNGYAVLNKQDDT